jgi:hypothetical protein
MSVAKQYESNIQLYSQELEQILRYQKLFSLLRFISFLLFLGSGYWYIAGGWDVIYLCISLSGFVLFLVCVGCYQNYHSRKAVTAQLLWINQQEYAAQIGENDAFSDGAWALDDAHDFAADLDIFGPGSIFPKINRTGTFRGEQALAELLKSPLNDVVDIRQYQEAVNHLKPQIQFRQLYLAQSRLAQESPKDFQELQEWMQQKPAFLGQKFLLVGSWVMRALTIISLIYYIQSGVYSFFVMCVLANFLIIGSQTAKIHQIHARVGRKEQLLRKYSLLFTMVSKTSNFLENELLSELQHRTKQADTALLQLSKVVNLLDQRMNLLVNLFLNGTFLFDLICITNLEKWKARYHEKFDSWFAAMEQMEVFNSLSTFSFNHPTYVQPIIKTEAFFVAEGLGHPLIDASKCIRNSISLGGDLEEILIITGSNMSGKSTFLRSIGLNWVLGLVGLPVCANKMEIFVTRMMTSMRIKDSVSNHTSYFQAELKRLQHLVRIMKSGERVFFLMDEILKGTNSEDKLAGSLDLIRHLLQYDAYGLIATHDLELHHLEVEEPGRISNYCFESTISQNEIQFDYLLQRGVAKNRNATFLMKQMGII